MKVVNYFTATSLSTEIFSFPNKTIKFAVVQTITYQPLFQSFH